MENRKPDITQWAKEAKEHGLRLGVSLEEILKDSIFKKKRLQESGLPIGMNYGPFNSFEDIEKVVPEEKKKDIFKYFLRCVPRDYDKNPNLIIERFEDLTYEKAKDVFNKISGDSGKYTVNLFETWKPEYSGGLIINNGRVMIDLEEGDRFLSKDGSIGGANLDLSGEETGKVEIHFNYFNNPKEKEKEIMLNVVKYLNPNLEREKFEQLKVYTEYFFKSGEGFKFVDYFEGEKVDKYTSFVFNLWNKK